MSRAITTAFWRIHSHKSPSLLNLQPRAHFPKCPSRHPPEPGVEPISVSGEIVPSASSADCESEIASSLPNRQALLTQQPRTNKVPTARRLSNANLRARIHTCAESTRACATFHRLRDDQRRMLAAKTHQISLLIKQSWPFVASTSSTQRGTRCRSSCKTDA